MRNISLIIALFAMLFLSGCGNKKAYEVMPDLHSVQKYKGMNCNELEYTLDSLQESMIKMGGYVNWHKDIRKNTDAENAAITTGSIVFLPAVLLDVVAMDDGVNSIWCAVREKGVCEQYKQLNRNYKTALHMHYFKGCHQKNGSFK